MDLNIQPIMSYRQDNFFTVKFKYKNTKEFIKCRILNMFLLIMYVSTTGVHIIPPKC